MVPSVRTDICRNLLRTDPCLHDFPTARESSLALLLAMGSQPALKALDIRRKRQCQMRQEYKLGISFSSSVSRRSDCIKASRARIQFLFP